MAALVLLSLLSLVLLTGLDGGARMAFFRQQDLWFLSDWRLVSLTGVALIYILIDGGRSWRRPRRDRYKRLLIVGLGWLAVTAVAVFAFDVGTTRHGNFRAAVDFVVTGVVAEELLYRGAIFSAAETVASQRRLLGLPFPVVFSALLFALGHLQYYGFDFGLTSELRWYTPFMGLVLGVLRNASGSIWPPIAVHSLSNILSLLAGGDDPVGWFSNTPPG